MSEEHTEETSAYVEAEAEPDDRPLPGFYSEEPVPQEPLGELDIWAEASPAPVLIDGEWVEAGPEEEPPPAAQSVVIDEAPEPFLDGDGPFAVAVDAPAENRFAEALSPPPPLPTVAPEVVETLNRPIAVRRRVPKKKKKPAAGTATTTRPSARERPGTYRAPRRYPKLRALLKNPGAVPAGPGGSQRRVPGTFFPTRPEAPVTAEAAGLEGLLSTMAEGLLIGESGDGQAEVRITLRDEFFAGTELRLVVGQRGLRAELHPPDRTTYWHLSGEAHALEQRLLDRGLRVESVEVCEP